MKWSICIPTIGENTIYSVLDAIFVQHVDFNYEVIVCGKIPAPLFNDNRIIIRDIGKTNPGRARNIAASIAKGRNLAFLDSDCIPDSNWLLNLDFAMSKNVQIVGGGINFPVSRYFETADNVSSFFDQSIYGDFRAVSTVASANLACTKNAFEDIGEFDESLDSAEDLEWILRAKRKGRLIYHAPNAFCTHVGGRKTFLQILRHSASWGKNSILVRKKYTDVLPTPDFFFSPSRLFALSPFIGIGFAFYIILSKGMLKYFHTFPAVAAAKTLWCIQASRSLSENENRV